MDTTDQTKGGKRSPRDASVWLAKLKAYKTDFEAWLKRCDTVDKLYSRRERSDTADREYALFWANIEVLKPAAYARPPVPVVAPRFKDGNPLAREASEVLERCCIVNMEHADVDGLMRRVRDDFLLYSRGTAWVRMAGEAVEYDYVAPADFAHGKAKVWRDVPWVARRSWITRKQGVERFGEGFRDVPIKPRDEDRKTADKDDKAPVWEIWCKDSGAVYWVAEDHKDMLDEQPPLFDLRGFFPCPQPAFGTIDPKNLTPIPEFVQYKDQVEEINEYTARIAALSEALRMKGFYAAGAGEISDAIEAAMKSRDDRAILVPISSFGALGGAALKDQIVWLPVVDVINLVRGLVELRRVVIEDVYQITGISDIVRGQSDASETLGAQQLKSQWGSMRIRERQQELARFARDLVRITAEIMAEQFDVATLLAMAQRPLPTAGQKAQAQAIADQAQANQQPLPPELTRLLKQPSIEEIDFFLKDDRARGFIIEVETDSTIQPDEDAEKQRRIEFTTAVGGIFQQAAPLVMQAPMLGPFMVEVLKFAASGFRAGRPLEQAIDELGEQLRGMAEKAAQPQEPQPDPAIELKQAELALKEREMGAKLQFEQQRHEQAMAFDQQKHQAEMAARQDDRAFERQRQAMDREAEAAKIDELKAMMTEAVAVITQAADRLTAAAQMNAAEEMGVRENA